MAYEMQAFAKKTNETCCVGLWGWLSHRVSTWPS